MRTVERRPPAAGPGRPVVRRSRRARPAAALLPGLLTAAALVAAPFAGTTTGPLMSYHSPSAPALTSARAYRPAHQDPPVTPAGVAGIALASVGVAGAAALRRWAGARGSGRA